MVVQGYGAVGRHTARFLAEKGCMLVGAADSSGTIADPAGLDIAALTAHKQGGGEFASLPGAQPADAVIGIPCDIWIPAARPDVLRAENVGRLDARMVAQGANIPATAEAEAALAARGVLVLPDFIANAGGVISAAVEYAGGTEAAAFAAIAEKIERNMAEVLARTERMNSSPRAAALSMARERVLAATTTRRWR